VTIAIVFMFALAFSAFVGWLADRKGRSFVGWALVALFFHLLALLIVLVLPSKKHADAAV
jgi:MFS family permease